MNRKDRDDYRKECRQIVLERSRGICEACHRPGKYLDWAHLAGRSHILAEELASSPELTCALCRECHSAIDQGRNPNTQRLLRSIAIERLIERWGISPPEELMDDPLCCVRWFERALRDNGALVS